jgi:hypothetical protein
MLKNVVDFKSELESYLNIIAEQNNLDHKIRKGEARMEGFLYYCRTISVYAQKPCENTVYLTSHLVPRDFSISKCNFNLLWATISSTSFIQCANVPNLGYC